MKRTLLFLIFLFIFNTQIWGGVGTFGLSSGTNTYSISSGNPQAFRFLNNVGSGTLTTIELLFNDSTPAGSVKIGVYSDSSGSPGSLVLDAGETTVSNGWVTISGLNLSVTNDTYYWLAFTLSSSNDISFITTGPSGSHAFNAYAYSSGLPNPFGTPLGTNGNQAVIRATVSYDDPTTTTTSTTSTTSTSTTSSTAAGATTSTLRKKRMLTMGVG